MAPDRLRFDISHGKAIAVDDEKLLHPAKERGPVASRNRPSEKTSDSDDLTPRTPRLKPESNPTGAAVATPPCWKMPRPRSWIHLAMSSASTPATMPISDTVNGLSVADVVAC